MESSTQEKRGPGRPRKGQRKTRIEITLSLEVLTALDQTAENRSGFIEECLRQHPQLAKHLTQKQ